MKIVGVEHKSGNYKGFDYDNYFVHVVDDSPYSQCIAGSLTDTYKVKACAVRDVFGGKIETEKDFASLIGHKADILCNKYGDPIRITLSD